MRVGWLQNTSKSSRGEFHPGSRMPPEIGKSKAVPVEIRGQNGVEIKVTQTPHRP